MTSPQPLTPGDIDARIRTLADEIHDPCACGMGVKLGIATLGLIRGIDLVGRDGRFDLTLTLCVTEIGCLYFGYFEDELRVRLTQEPWLAELTIKWLSPMAWSPSDIGPAGRAALAEARFTLAEPPRETAPLSR